MKFLKKNICTITSLALFAVFAFSGMAFAAEGDVMGQAEDKAIEVFQAVKSIMFILGGFGLVVLAFMAVFGKLDWKKFSMLAVGLAILAAAGAIIDYATGANKGSEFEDTFK